MFLSNFSITESILQSNLNLINFFLCSKIKLFFVLFILLSLMFSTRYSSSYVIFFKLILLKLTQSRIMVCVIIDIINIVMNDTLLSKTLYSNMSSSFFRKILQKIRIIFKLIAITVKIHFILLVVNGIHIGIHNVIW